MCDARQGVAAPHKISTIALTTVVREMVGPMEPNIASIC
jgi:hypothetical protein